MPDRPKRHRPVKVASGTYRPPGKPRGSAAARGYDAIWRKVRMAHLMANPVCVTQGCGRSAVDVDHIVPHQDGGGRLDRNNLQSFCHSCHSRKTPKDVKRRKGKA